MTGRMIAFDGVDGSGKSTQIELLRDWLLTRDLEVVLVRDPGGTVLGESLREILLHRQDIPLSITAEMLLYMASRAELVAEVIRPALEADKVVLADRFLLANVVYQGVAGGLPSDYVWQVGLVATGGLRPDLTLLMDIDPESAMTRIQRGLDRLESRGLDYFRKVRSGFLDQASKASERVEIIDATQSIADIQYQIQAAVELLW
ncbi:MAG: dTMP kinase [Planctomycetales bacterium]|nr:dTMP kinase [Planctomycetales bacterium]